MIEFYKILGPDRMPCHGGVGQWPPPGEWREEAGPLRVGRPGTLHLLLVEDVPHWVVCPGEVWIAEASGPVEVANDKVGVLRASLVRRVGVLTPSVLAAWARECAARAAAYADDAAAARDAARDDDDARATARADAAALAAARAARAAAYADAYTAYADAVAANAALAALAAAYAAYAAAAYDDERRWQGERLLALLAQHEEDR